MREKIYLSTQLTSSSSSSSSASSCFAMAASIWLDSSLMSNLYILTNAGISVHCSGSVIKERHCLVFHVSHPNINIHHEYECIVPLTQVTHKLCRTCCTDVLVITIHHTNLHCTGLQLPSPCFRKPHKSDWTGSFWFSLHAIIKHQRTTFQRIIFVNIQIDDDIISITQYGWCPSWMTHMLEGTLLCLSLFGRRGSCATHTLQRGGKIFMTHTFYYVESCFRKYGPYTTHIIQTV